MPHLRAVAALATRAIKINTDEPGLGVEIGDCCAMLMAVRNSQVWQQEIKDTDNEVYCSMSLITHCEHSHFNDIHGLHLKSAFVFISHKMRY